MVKLLCNNDNEHVLAHYCRIEKRDIANMKEMVIANLLLQKIWVLIAYLVTFHLLIKVRLLLYTVESFYSRILLYSSDVHLFIKM